MKKVVFFSSRIHFDGDYLEKRGLGGSESAAINLSRAIKRRYPNIEVVLYNGDRTPTEYDGVLYKKSFDFYTDCKNFDADVFVSLRESGPFMLPFIDAKVKVFWTQDLDNEPDMQILAKNHYARKNVDLFLAISNYALNNVKKAFPEKIVKLQRNGYNSQLNSPFPDPRDRQPIAVYTSTPFRGLDVLAEVWPIIYKKCNDLNVKPTLRVYGGMGLYKQHDNQFIGLYKKLNAMEGVEIRGVTPQYDLYKDLKEASVMLYPNHFLESGCMAVLEAIACGVWVVTTDLGALGEQVVNHMNGDLIEGDSRSPYYKDKFVGYAVSQLVNPRIPATFEKVVYSWDEQASTFFKNINDCR